MFLHLPLEGLTARLISPKLSAFVAKGTNSKVMISPIFLNLPLEGLAAGTYYLILFTYLILLEYYLLT